MSSNVQLFEQEVQPKMSSQKELLEKELLVRASLRLMQTKSEFALNDLINSYTGENKALKIENSQLKAKNKRLRAELATLRGAARISTSAKSEAARHEDVELKIVSTSSTPRQSK